jgi:hypothetical protein
MKLQPVSMRLLFAGTCTLLGLGANASRAQQAVPPATLPFQPGEALTYQVRVSRVGDVGTGRMWIEGPVLEGNTPVWRLRFDMDAGKGPIRASDRTSSWLEPIRFGIVRFEKTERHVLSRSEERVRIDSGSGRWSDADGRSGPLGSDAPLDELSFIYLLRTLPLHSGAVFRLDRHFDAARNPTIVRVVGRDTLTTPAGIFRTHIIEMEVRDPKRYRGTGIIRLHIDESGCRMPIRIESRMPVLGVTTLTLTSWLHPPPYPGAELCDG